jgi:hypothetical protein
MKISLEARGSYAAAARSGRTGQKGKALKWFVSQSRLKKD